MYHICQGYVFRVEKGYIEFTVVYPQFPFNVLSSSLRFFWFSWLLCVILRWNCGICI